MHFCYIIYCEFIRKQKAKTLFKNMLLTFSVCFYAWHVLVQQRIIGNDIIIEVEMDIQMNLLPYSSWSSRFRYCTEKNRTVIVDDQVEYIFPLGEQNQPENVTSNPVANLTMQPTCQNRAGFYKDCFWKKDYYWIIHL